MTDLVVADTSVFIDDLRGSSDDALAVLILKNRILLSPVVRLELLAGVKKARLKVIEGLCNTLRRMEEFASPMNANACSPVREGAVSLMEFRVG